MCSIGFLCLPANKQITKTRCLFGNILRFHLFVFLPCQNNFMKHKNYSNKRLPGTQGVDEQGDRLWYGSVSDPTYSVIEYISIFNQIGIGIIFAQNLRPCTAYVSRI